MFGTLMGIVFLYQYELEMPEAQIPLGYGLCRWVAFACLNQTETRIAGYVMISAAMCIGVE
jgi:uncharacterized protein YebE (UPF0316 family)